MAAHDRTRLTGPPRTFVVFLGQRDLAACHDLRGFGFLAGLCSPACRIPSFSSCFGAKILCAGEKNVVLHKVCCPIPGETRQTGDLAALLAVRASKLLPKTWRQLRGWRQGLRFLEARGEKDLPSKHKMTPGREGPGATESMEPETSRGRRSRPRSPRERAWGSGRPREPGRRRARRRGWCRWSRWARW